MVHDNKELIYVTFNNVSDWQQKSLTVLGYIIYSLKHSFKKILYYMFIQTWLRSSSIQGIVQELTDTLILSHTQVVKNGTLSSSIFPSTTTKHMPLLVYLITDILPGTFCRNL